MSVLIVTLPGDLDSWAVRLAIRHLGAECRIFYPADFAGGAQWSIDPDQNCLDEIFRGKRTIWAFDDYSSVWMRRPLTIAARDYIENVRERSAAESDSASVMSSVLRILERGKFVASRFNATRIATEKTYQFRVAREVGLPMPRTLISNSYERIVQFFDECEGEVVYKPLREMLWPSKVMLHGVDKAFGNLPTCVLSRDLLDTTDLVSAPGIFQRKVDKVSEIRVTVLGKTFLAVAKRFPNRPRTEIDVDWRRMYRGAQYTPHELPAEIQDKCLRLLKELGLVMGIFDFIVDDEGRYLFLEVNPQGQFLVGDDVCPGMNHLEAMAEFLMSRDPEFQYSGRNKVRLTDISDELLGGQWRQDDMRDHFGDVLTSRYGAVTVSLTDNDTDSPVGSRAAQDQATIPAAS